MPDSAMAPPRQVIIALSLMAVNVFILNVFRTILVVTGTLSGRIAGSDVIYKIIDEFVIWGFSIGLIVLVGYGFNWARWLNLVLAILNIGLMIYRAVGASATDSYSALALPIAYVTLETTSLYLLFLSPGKLWFERRETPASA